MEDTFRNAILSALGNAPEYIEPGRIHRFSTSDRPRDQAGWCRLFEDGHGGVFGDFRTGMSSSWQARRQGRLKHADRVDMARNLAQAKARRATAEREQQQENGHRNKSLWSRTLAVSDGDPVSLYLRRRGLTGPVPEHLRLHPNLIYADGVDRSTWPAMVAPLVGPDGYVVALHRTYLTPDGYKAPVPTVKKLTPAAGLLAGACIPLHAPCDGVIAIAEGIETAQAVHLASGLPTVAAYCAGNLAAFVWPEGVKKLMIFADADEAGIKAARDLERRAAHAGISAVIMTPKEQGQDWCDVWASRQRDAEAAITVATEDAP